MKKTSYIIRQNTHNSLHINKIILLYTNIYESVCDVFIEKYNNMSIYFLVT